MKERFGGDGEECRGAGPGWFLDGDCKSGFAGLGVGRAYFVRAGEEVVG